MKRHSYLVLFILCVTAMSVFAQESVYDDVVANSKISPVRLTGFEDASFWKVAMPIDQGIISSKIRRGAPKDIAGEIPNEFDAEVFEDYVLKNIEDGDDASTIEDMYVKDSRTTYIYNDAGEAEEVKYEYYKLNEDEGKATRGNMMKARDIFDRNNLDEKVPQMFSSDKVLGVKVEYLQRGYNWFSVKPIKPISIEGRCQSISVWIAGRNYRHTVKIILKDFNGEDRILYMGKLNFIGWKKLTTYIPDNKIVKQWDHHFVDKEGIKFNGFLIECDPAEAYGTYYIYFDELRATTDLFNESTRDDDDMRDDW